MRACSTHQYRILLPSQSAESGGIVRCQDEQLNPALPIKIADGHAGRMVPGRQDNVLWMAISGAVEQKRKDLDVVDDENGRRGEVAFRNRRRSLN